MLILARLRPPEENQVQSARRMLMYAGHFGRRIGTESPGAPRSHLGMLTKLPDEISGTSVFALRIFVVV